MATLPPFLAPATTPQVRAEQISEPLRPLPWLLVILALALVLRIWKLTVPLQQDEFGAVYAVAERKIAPGQLPTAADPLLPVANLQEVSERSILPYGIRNPYPLYHYLLYGFIHFLPVAEWSLRLPSLLAGLGCVLGIYFLCRRPLGEEVALIAALLVAVDAMQVTVSGLVRPYALANLACIGSFAALFTLVQDDRRGRVLLACVAYGVTVAAIAYLNPVLLLVGFAHLGLVVYALLTRPLLQLLPRLLLWGLGGVLALLLLVPELGYLQEVRQFARNHKEFLFNFAQRPLAGFFAHNLLFLASLLALSLGMYILREVRGQDLERQTAEENPAFLWMARFWLFFPQLVALALAFGDQQAVFLSRYLSYTSLAAAILLAYWTSRDRSRDVRLGMGLGMAVFVFLFPFAFAVSRGHGLVTHDSMRMVVTKLNELDEKGKWQPGDVVLIRPGFQEADLLPDGVPVENRKHVAGVQLAPFTTLYAPRTPKPMVALSLSERFGKLHTTAGQHFERHRFYNADLVAELRSYQRFWLVSEPWDRQIYYACFLPWLADALGWDVKVARNRRLEAGDRYFDVPTDVRPDDWVEGLSNSQPSDFSAPLHLIRRKSPKGIWQLGALGLVPLPKNWFTVPVWLAAHDRTPRITERPHRENEGSEQD